MLYQELLAEITIAADEKYRDFHKRLLKNDNINVLGVRVPILRKIAKAHKDDADALLSFPDEYYEVTFIKLTAVSYLNYEQFIKYVDICVPLIDNWATCDSFCPKCVEKHREEFIPYIRKYAAVDKEFYQRFALTALLHYYVCEEYAEEIFGLIERCNLNFYYVHTAAAWLIAEMLVKNFESAENFLLKNTLDENTYNKAIRKACESYRLSDERKNYLKGIKK